MTYDVIKEMEDYYWEGNIRQLKNVIENMVIVSNNEFLQPNDLPWHSKYEELKASAKLEERNEVKIMPLERAVEQLERQILLKARDELKSSRQIAEALEVDQSTIVRKMKKYGISPK
jgi:TyrR family helix-turn-helix protein